MSFKGQSHYYATDRRAACCNAEYYVQCLDTTAIKETTLEEDIAKAKHLGLRTCAQVVIACH
jgi:hypothetical protein